MYKRYVDDVNIVCEAISTRFIRRSRRNKPTNVNQDEAPVVEGCCGGGGEANGDLSSDRVTAETLCKLANLISPGMIQMEVDYPSNHLGGKLPILDLEVWVEGAKVLHRFYKKSMATKMVILARSAIPTSSKRSILIAEALRRMLNCHPDLPRKEKADYLTEFCVRMADCGHSQRSREVVVKRATEKYSNSMMGLANGSKAMYRSKEDKQEQEKIEGGLKKTKTGWFKSLGYNGTVTVPATVDSVLLKSVEQALKNTDAPGGYRTLVVEDGGRTMASDVVRSNPFPKNNCQRPRCGICISGDSKGSCWKSGVVYKIECNREPCIREEEKDTVPLQVAVYVGETCRTIHARGVEHQDLYSNKKESSFMYRHAIERHGGVIDNFVKDFSWKPL